MEIGVRLTSLNWGEEHPRFCEYDPELGWIGKPGAQGDLRSIDFNTVIQQNQRGLRGPKWGYAKEPHERRILFLGDSFTWGYGVNLADRFSEVVQRTIGNVTVVNAGCSGYGTDQELLYYRHEGRKYHPDIVVVMMHLRSDLKNNISSKQYGYYKPVLWFNAVGMVTFKNIPVARNSMGYSLSRLLARDSALWRLIKDKLFSGKKIEDAFAQIVDRIVGSEEPAIMSSNLDAVESTCQLSKAIATDVRRDQRRSLFVLIPDIEPATSTFVHNPAYNEVRKCLASEGIAMLDLDPLFREFLRLHTDTQVVFNHDRHWNSEGHRLAGELIAQRLAEGMME